MNASENVVTSYVGRWVAFLLIPILGALTAWLGAHGLDLDSAEVTAWVIGVVGGLTTWLYNRGRYEVAKVSGLTEDAVDGIVQKVIEQKLPAPPQAPAPGAGSPAAPGAPPAVPGGTSGGQ